LCGSTGISFTYHRASLYWDFVTVIPVSHAILRILLRFFLQAERAGAVQPGKEKAVR